MARAADFFEIFKNSMTSAGERNRKPTEDIRGFFEDLLLDPEFDEMDGLDDGAAEFQLCREIHGQPESFQ